MLVGDTNESDVLVEGVDTHCLVDTGSMVSTISETFFNHHLRSFYDLQPLTNLLSVEVGGGHLLQYLGYVDWPFSSQKMFLVTEVLRLSCC